MDSGMGSDMVVVGAIALIDTHKDSRWEVALPKDFAECQMLREVESAGGKSEEFHMPIARVMRFVGR
jgi:hypothetical protein